MPRFHSGPAIHRPETTDTTLPPLPEVIWQQPRETHLINFHKKSTSETHKITHTPEFRQKNDVNQKRCQWGKPHLKYPDRLRNNSEKIKLGAHQYNASITRSKANLKSNKSLLT